MTVTALAAAEGVAIAIQNMPTPTFSTEDELQVAIYEQLASTYIGCGVEPAMVMREVPLSDARSRIDVIVFAPVTGGFTVGVEVKLAGGAPAVRRQLDRYAACAELDALVLATTRASHLHLSGVLEGKPIVVATLIGLL
ncbi:hypothetical protein GRS96_12485 [Rathayibacter sp. VKM Ac-2803]|uniref:hypothetical protein n=1 Tax=Rathayibacter sp. VKM Ac-2803 TaxID=2609256 RepID=UPI00135BD70D|nr:hypothetical protein [Rathayibacter sp. VKM Ac-2803]MWV50086.1 hypothetical protein [Rathayibacter sp. VKM Ac-2803]